MIVGAARTPIGSYLGTLSAVSATQLGSFAIGAAIEQSTIPKSAVQELWMGCVLTAGLGQAPARQACLGADLPHTIPCTTINKVCGSGLQAVVMAAQSVALGNADIVIAGGMESMSNAPHLLAGLRKGIKMGHQQMIDSMVHDGLWNVYDGQHMGSCAELCATKHNISREAQDTYAIESYKRALYAQQNDLFSPEIVPVAISTRKGQHLVSEDEEPARGHLEKLPTLRTAFAKKGTITAGNASSLNDGAAAIVVMSGEAAQKNGVPVLARIVGYGHHAHEPEWFTTAPSKAIRNACKHVGWSPTQVDLWEINEAFSVVSLVNNAELGLDATRVNVHGGAVSLGHPIGASGARILVTLLYAMQKRQAKTGCASLCIGGGEGIALLVER